MARRQRSSGDEGGGANWMDTYGDMVTLLLAFFVLLFSFSTIDASKWEALVGSLSGTGTSVVQVLSIQQAVDRLVPLEINTAANDPSSATDTTSGNSEQDLENFLNLVMTLQAFIDENELAADLFPERETLTIILRVRDNVFFDSGDAMVKSSSFDLIDDLSALFAENIAIIETIKIEGHTDTDPIHTLVYEDNWDLSTKRATNTLRRILMNDGIDPVKIIPIGMGEYHPVATNETSAGKAQNRRVDFIIQSLVSSE